MVRHLLAACVVCLLCADHLPCQQHEVTTSINKISNGINLHVVENLNIIAPDSRLHEDIIEIDPANDVRNPYSNQIPYKKFYEKQLGTTESIKRATATDLIANSKKLRNFSSKNNENNLNRIKRHTNKNHQHHDHFHDDNDVHHVPEVTKLFIDKIFQQFGNGNHMTLNDFESILKKLGLTELLNNTNYNKNDSDLNLNDNCISHKELLMKMYPNEMDILNNNLLNQNNNDLANDDVENNFILNKTNIYSICPIILHQLISKKNLEKYGCIVENELTSLQQHIELTEPSEEKDMYYVWLFSFLCVLFCGLLGLVGVAIIPFMNSKYYRDIIQFLVALAIGTMTGDALLHLLPHAILGDTEEKIVMKGLVCVCGIILFYATEHGLIMISEWRRNVAKKSSMRQNNSKKVHVERDPESTASVNQSANGDTVCKNKYNSSPHCFDEFSMEQTGNNMYNQNKHEQQINHLNNHHHHLHEEQNETAQSLLQKTLPDSNTISTNLDDGAMGDHHHQHLDYNNKDKLSVSIILREHDHMHHGHSHKHGHVHSPPETLSAVAWMIILGDGLHNFTDGMAIGAAFSENIAGGFSTSLAVFCHELPHELGDFAILIKAGMSVKSAVYYNLLTGALSFIGMIFGILFGSTPEASQWMFAIAAGLFIYIALVDMMPEMTSAHNTLQHILLQILGLFTGLLSMLLIALYEHDLMTLFNSSSGHGHNH